MSRSRADLASPEGLLSLNDENLASIAHDLRNPLAIVELETQHLQRLLRPLGLSAAQNSLERVNQNVTFMTALIDDILDLARSEAGRLRLELEPADLADMLTHLLGRAVAAYDRDRVVLDLRDRATARIDSARIQRVVENLVRNALAHAPARSRVIVRLEAQRDRAQISVIDSGPGLTPEEAESVFVRYWQGPATRDHQGQGLGLHVSRKIVEAHGGRLDVETTPGAGSRFFFELPVTRV